MNNPQKASVYGAFNDELYEYYPGLSSESELYLFKLLKRSKTDAESLLYESILLSREEISSVIDFIKLEIAKNTSGDAPKISTVINLTKKARKYISLLKDMPYSKIDFCQNIENFDPKVQKIFCQLIEIELPKIILTEVKVLLSLNDDQSLLLMIEYMKFLILKYFFPEDTY